MAVRSCVLLSRGLTTTRPEFFDSLERLDPNIGEKITFIKIYNRAAQNSERITNPNHPDEVVMELNITAQEEICQLQYSEAWTKYKTLVLKNN